MALKIGIMGGANHLVPADFKQKAEQLGEAVASRGCVLVTGACPGLPLAAARGAKRHGGLVVGISPGLSLDEHVYKYESPAAYHDVLVFTGSGLMGREVVNIRSSDIVVIVGGGSGTLGELAIAYDEGKLIGVLTGTGGISDHVKSILVACQKETGARVIYDTDPSKLIEETLRVYRTEHFRRPSCFCHACDLSEQSPPAPNAVRDVVCGMWIDPARAVAKRTISTRRYVFCSLACAARFDEDIATFLDRE
ncbi:MAG: hypothetical protein WD648_09580 [Planctomycetaceae bacterium]